MSKLLIADDHGNPIDKQYKDLTSRELNAIVENLCVRLYLFNYEYPRFLPQIVKAIIEHPNLLTSDKDHLDTYCKMFELDWRGDRSYQTLQEFMFNTPIHVEGENIKSYGVVTNEEVEERLMRACAPYVDEVAANLQSFTA